MDSKEKKRNTDRPVTVHITNHNQFQKGVGAFITNLNHLTIVMDAEGNMKLDANQTGIMPHTAIDADEEDEGKGDVSDERLARAIENCQALFWANSAYAVVYCICRDDFKMAISQLDFERMMEQLPYKKKRDHTCPKGTIANAFSDNPIFSEHVDNWGAFKPLARIVKLRDALRNELK